MGDLYGTGEDPLTNLEVTEFGNLAYGCYEAEWEGVSLNMVREWIERDGLMPSQVRECLAKADPDAAEGEGRR